MRYGGTKGFLLCNSSPVQWHRYSLANVSVPRALQLVTHLEYQVQASYVTFQNYYYYPYLVCNNQGRTVITLVKVKHCVTSS